MLTEWLHDQDMPARSILLASVRSWLVDHTRKNVRNSLDVQTMVGISWNISARLHPYLSWAFLLLLFLILCAYC